jgi:hypothetical protein
MQTPIETEEELKVLFEEGILTEELYLALVDAAILSPSE